MAIRNVRVNHSESNYFNDGEEIRTDEMLFPSAEKVARAIDKLVRRYRSRKECDVLFVTNDDGTGWRLMYDTASMSEPRKLRLRHFTSMRHNSWDTDENVSVTYAKEAIIGDVG